MLICHCAVVTDTEIRQAIAAGARSIHDLQQACRAGAECQGCWPALMQLLDSAPLDVGARDTRRPVPSSFRR